MRQPLDRPLADTFVACVEYYRTNARNRLRKKPSEPYKQVQRKLTAALQAMAALHAASYSGWDVDRDHAGYLLKFEPPMLFRVPYHVLPSFPTGEELESLWRLSRTIRCGAQSVISISGSNVMRKIFDVVGDVDFCEYFSLRDTDGFKKIAANMDGNGRVACMRLVLLDQEWKAAKEWRYPWGADRPREQFFATAFDSSDENKSMMKIDYVGEVDHIGVTEITNIVIVIDDRGKSASLSKTFAAQEAPLVPIDSLPNQMNNPIEMGRYINWLSEAIITLSEKGDMRKCLKRCASLARVLFLPAITDEIIKVADDNVLLSHKLEQMARLSAILEPLMDHRSLELRRSLLQQKEEMQRILKKRGGPPDEPARRRFDHAASRIATQLLMRVRPGYDPSSRKAA